MSPLKALFSASSRRYNRLNHTLSSIMPHFGPSGYAMARESLLSPGNAAHDVKTVAHVEDRPYFPLFNVDSSNESSLVEGARLIIAAYYPSIDIEDDKKVKVTRISGGLTNALFKIDFPEKSILIRIFGAEGMIDRDLETATFARLCGPPHKGSANNLESENDGSGKVVHRDLDMIGRFANGRVESWIPNMKQSCLEDFDSNLMCGVARVLARLHYGFEVPSYLYEAECREVDGRRERVRVLKPGLWDVINSWIEELDGALSQKEFDADLLHLFSKAVLGKAASKDETVSYVKQETNWLQRAVQQHHPKAVVAFTHNDLCMANILLDQRQDADPCIIDYEYGSINYTMYDVANFFCELCGGNDNGVPDLELFPPKERQKEFLKEYVGEKRRISQQNVEEIVNNNDDISDLLSQIELFQLASNLIWGVWGVLQACGETSHDDFCKEKARLRLDGEIDADSFDNLRYGMNRLRNYLVCKEKLSC